MKEYMAYFLFTFTSLFTIVNPFGALPHFSALTEGLDKKYITYIAYKTSLSACVALLLFAVTGQFIFNFFSISIDALRVVGGIVFFINGYDMLQGKLSRTRAPSSSEKDEINIFAITPLAIPIICGPGAITVTTVMYQEALSYVHRGIIIGTVLFVCLATFLFLLGSKQILKMLGRSGNKVFSRIMGLILMMIAVEFFFKGLHPYIQKLTQ